MLTRDDRKMPDNTANHQHNDQLFDVISKDTETDQLLSQNLKKDLNYLYKNIQLLDNLTLTGSKPKKHLNISTHN